MASTKTVGSIDPNMYTSFASDFSTEISRNTIHVLSQFPMAVFWVFIIFSFDPLSGNRGAKLMFVFGFLLLLLGGYGVCGIVFPSETKQAVSLGQSGKGPLSTMLFGNLKDISMYSILMSFVFSYWAVLNWTMSTESNLQISVIYLCTYIISMFFYGYVLEGQWTSMLVGSSFGFLVGASWAYLSYQYLTNPDYNMTDSMVATSQMGTVADDGTVTFGRVQKGTSRTQNNRRTSGEQSADMVCRAFRV